MKSQDIVVLFKLISLEIQAQSDHARKRVFAITREQGVQYLSGPAAESFEIPDVHVLFERVDLSDTQWEGWEDVSEDQDPVNADSYSMRALSASLGLSKSEISNSLNRCKEIGLIHTRHADGLPVVRSEALLDLVKYSIRYIFPARLGPVVRGIPTAFAAPVLEGKVISAGELIPVWPDAYGKKKGQEVIPLFRTVPGAVKKDYLLYHFLALVDAIRIGGPREAKVADAMLRKWIL